MEKQKHWREEYFPESIKYLKHTSLMNEDGKTFNKITVTIKSIKQETVVGEGGRSSSLPVMYFTDESIKPMVFNITNCGRLEDLTGYMIGKAWIGVTFVVGVEKVKAKKGGTVNGLRVDVKGAGNLKKKISGLLLKIKSSSLEQLTVLYKENQRLFASSFQLMEAGKARKEALKELAE